MRQIFSTQNEHAHELEVWVEPFCNSYRVPPGATLTLYADPASELFGEPETEVSRERVILWLEETHAPDAELNGKPLLPNQQ